MDGYRKNKMASLRTAKRIPHTMMQGPHRNGAGLFYAVQLPTYQFVDIDL